MKSSKRDFEEFVDIIRRLEKGDVKRLMWAHAMADLLKKSNPRFNKERFLAAVKNGLENSA